MRFNNLLLTVTKELNKLLTQKGEKIKNAQYELLAEQTSY